MAVLFLVSSGNLYVVHEMVTGANDFLLTIKYSTQKGMQITYSGLSCVKCCNLYCLPWLLRCVSQGTS